MRSYYLTDNAVHHHKLMMTKLDVFVIGVLCIYFNADIPSLQNADGAAATTDPSRELCSQVLQYDERISIHSG